VTPPLFFAELSTATPGAPVAVTGDEGRHAADVRRLRPGEHVDLTDGAGTLAHGQVGEVRRGELTVVIAEREVVPAPSPRLVVAQALARGGRDEQAVESMTEVGVDEVVGWAAARCVARWSDRTALRWAATSRSAAKQSRRAWWPLIDGPATTESLAQRCARAGRAFVLHESAAEPLATQRIDGVTDVLVVVGPEGGITEEELAVLTGAGATAVRLGPGILRSSTAGTAALAVICAMTRWRMGPDVAH